LPSQHAGENVTNSPVEQDDLLAREQLYIARERLMRDELDRLQRDLSDLRSRRTINWGVFIPIITAIVTAAGAFALNSYSEILKANAAREKAALDLEIDIIKKSLEKGSPAESKTNLEFFIAANVLKNFGGGIKTALATVAPPTFAPQPQSLNRLKNYGVVKGDLIAFRPDESGTSVRMHVAAAGTAFGSAVGLTGSDGFPAIYAIIEITDDRFVKKIEALADGHRALPETDREYRLDYFRSEVFGRIRWTGGGAVTAQTGTELANAVSSVSSLLKEAQGNSDYKVILFGRRWGPESRPDAFFGLTPGNSIFSTGLNQGGAAANAPWQDGAVLLFNTKTRKLTAVLTADYTQCMTFDKATDVLSCG
jgi:uncharacterized protein YukJ